MTNEIIDEIVARVGAMPGVVAVAMGGSTVTGVGDAQSDVDLYVYSPEPPPVALRAELARRYDPEPEINNQAFGPGDEWAAGGTGIDLIYWSPAWIESQLARVLDEHQPSVGYSTAFWRTVRQSVPLLDPTGWFARLQSKARRPYPEPLRHAIIANNRPLLRDARSSFLHQIERAIARDDAVSVQHRTAALLASWFDVLFALNRLPHPGEKRLLAISRTECALVPERFEEQIAAVLAATPPPWHDGRLIVSIQALVDGLEALPDR